MRRWRQKWILVWNVRNVQGVTFCKESTALIMDEEKLSA
jgi:hypothetical protein